MAKASDHDEVRRLIAEENAQLVEVLSAEEFAEEHITGAMNIPLKQLDECAPSDFVDRTLSQQVAKLTTEITRGS